MINEYNSKPVSRKRTLNEVRHERSLDSQKVVEVTIKSHIFAPPPTNTVANNNGSVVKKQPVTIQCVDKQWKQNLREFCNQCHKDLPNASMKLTTGNLFG